MTRLGARHVPVKHLLHEQRDGRGGVQLAITPGVTQFVARLLDHNAIQGGQGIMLETPDRSKKTGHPWPPVNR